MTDLARDNVSNPASDLEHQSNLKPKRWEDTLEKPPLDYSDFFEDDVGQYPGLIVWEIDNFCPNRVEEALHGKFYEGDCYIVLRTFENENHNLDWQIYYWIGSSCTLDKKASSAMHAVNLRNFLSAHCRTIREEQNDESQAFLDLFPDGGITYIEGGRTLSGFYTLEEVQIITRMFCLHELSHRQLYMQAVELRIASLDARHVYIVDTGSKLYVWSGKKSKYTVRQKARLLAEKINKDERKCKSELIFLLQAAEPNEFWLLFDDAHQVDIKSHDYHVDDERMVVQGVNPILYRVCLGAGYLELPQVRYKPKQLTKDRLATKDVYIMDTRTDVYIWYA